MIDVFAIYPRPQSPEDFDRHYQGSHVPKVLAMPLLRELTWGKVESDDPSSPYLIARLTYDSVQDLEASMASPEGVVAREDLALFESSGLQSYVVPRA